MFPPSNGSSPLYRKSTMVFSPTWEMPTSSTCKQEDDRPSTVRWYSMSRVFSFLCPTYLFLVFLPHTQGEHSMEVWAGDGQQGSVSRDALVIGHQNHIAELVVLSLLVKTLQQLCSLFCTVKHLQTQRLKLSLPFVLSMIGKHLCLAFQNPAFRFWFILKTTNLRDFATELRAALLYVWIETSPDFYHLQILGDRHHVFSWKSLLDKHICIRQ